MNTLKTILKARPVGKSCKWAAWIILVIGLVQATCNVYLERQQLNLAAQALTGVQPVTEELQLLSLFLANLPTILFYFFLLYAVGVMVTHSAHLIMVPGKNEKGQMIMVEILLALLLFFTVGVLPAFLIWSLCRDGKSTSSQTRNFSARGPRYRDGAATYNQ